MSNEQETRITVRFPSALASQIRALAEDEKRSINSEIVVAVQHYVTRKRKERSKDATKDL